MDTAGNEPLCPSCGGRVPADAPLGVCPRCLGQVVLSLPASGPDPATTLAEAIEQIGPYKLLQEIGQGGCGVVYLAEQEKPIRRRVALKLIKEGMDTRQVIVRFEAERQALALMDHPNIAKVLDAGATESGRPYFVMELVPGAKITDYCDQQQLRTEERLRLFVQVCQALQHAHQKGIIHRDLKPSNILVTVQDGVPVPKVIDFGIAKATEQRLTEKTLFTALEQWMGTPAYMSPEQAGLNSLDVDTRSDLYSLGVVLYELLTGRTPFDAHAVVAQGIDALRQIIREAEPVRPSTRLAMLQSDELTTTARQRSAEAPRLISLLRGDLDWIVLKCLAKERSRRYETAIGLAGDIQRYLAHEPVTARPPSIAYRLQKAVRRHRLGFAAAGIVALALLVGAGLASWQALRATRAAREAERLLYGADMKLAQQALAEHNLGAALALLQRHVPQPGAPDLRGFEWRYLWQEARGQELRSLPLNAARSLAFSPDGRLLAVSERHGTKVIDVANWRVLLSLPSTNRSVQFSRSGETLLTTCVDNHARFWDTRTWQLKSALKGVTSLAAFAPDGLTLVCDSADGLQIWDAQPLRLLQTLPRQHFRNQWGSALRILGFSGDGQWMAALVEDSVTTGPNPLSIRLWQVEDLRQRGSAAVARTVAFSEAPVVATLTLNKDGSRLAVGTTVGHICVLDTRTSALVAHRLAPPVRAYRLRFLQDDRTLIGALSDQTVCAWAPSGTNLVPVGVLRGHLAEVGALAASSDEKYLASTDFSGVVKLWDASELNRGTSPSVSEIAPDLVHHLQFLADSRTLLAAGDTNASLWDIKTGHVRRLFPDVHWHAAARVSPNEKWIALGRTDGPVDIVDLATSTRVATLAGHTTEVRRVLFLPDSRRALTAAVFQEGVLGERLQQDSAVCLWEATSGRLLCQSNLTAKIAGIALAPDGDTFAVELSGGIAELRRTRDFALLLRMRVPYDDRTHLSYSPDGKLLVFAGGGRSNGIGLFDLSRRRFRLEMRGHDLYVSGVSFSPDGRTLATGSGDHTVRLWNLETGQEMLRLVLPDAVNQVLFSPDGRTLAASTYWVDAGRLRCEVRFFHAPTLEEMRIVQPP